MIFSNDKMMKVEEVDNKEFTEVKLDTVPKDAEKGEKTDDEKKDDKKKAEKAETVGLVELFKYADKLDAFLVIFAVLNAIACGCIFSVMYVMFGDITDTLTNYTPDNKQAFMDGAINFAIRISLVGK